MRSVLLHLSMKRQSSREERRCHLTLFLFHTPNSANSIQIFVWWLCCILSSSNSNNAALAGRRERSTLQSKWKTTLVCCDDDDGGWSCQIRLSNQRPYSIASPPLLQPSSCSWSSRSSFPEYPQVPKQIICLRLSVMWLLGLSLMKWKTKLEFYPRGYAPAIRIHLEKTHRGIKHDTLWLFRYFSRCLFSSLYAATPF